MFASQDAGVTHICESALHVQTDLLVACRLLIERYGYQTTFLITAALKAVAYVPLIPLLTVVDDGIGRFSCGWKRSQQEADEESDEISTQPLLS